MQTVILTRSAEDCAAWAAQLKERGIGSISLPCIRTERIEDQATRADLHAAIAKADWLVFTSPRGVDTVANLYGSELPESTQLAVVGNATGDRAIAQFGRVDFISTGTTAADLGQQLRTALDPEATGLIVLAIAENASPALQTTLQEAGYSVQRIDTYRTVPKTTRKPKHALSKLGGQGVFLASPSAVEGFVNQVNVDCKVPLISIGPTTSAALKRRGLEMARQAQQASLEGLISAFQEQA